MNNCKKRAIVLFAWMLAGSFLLTSCQRSVSRESSVTEAEEPYVIFTIDGYPVYHEEYELFLRSQRAATAQYFYETYGAEQDAEFWTTEYEGQTPENYNKEKALEELIAYKTERILAYERGIAEYVNFDDLMREKDGVNEKNSTSDQAGDFTYGIADYSPWQYLQYLRSVCDIELLKDESRRCKDRISEETLNGYYEEERQMYHKGYDVTYERLDMILSADKEQIGQQMKAVADRAEKEKISLEAAVKELQIADICTVNEYVTSEVEVGKDDLFEVEIQQTVLELEPGTVSEPIISSFGSGTVLRCIERKDLGYYNFDEVKDDIIICFAEESLEDLLDERIRNAEIVQSK